MDQAPQNLGSASTPEVMKFEEIIQIPTDIERVVRLLNRAFRTDPRAITNLLGIKVSCGINLAMMDHIVNEDERDRRFYVTAFGPLNAVVALLTGHLVTVVVQDGQVTGFSYQKASERY